MVDLDCVLEVLSQLESFSITKEALEVILVLTSGVLTSIEQFHIYLMKDLVLFGKLISRVTLQRIVRQSLALITVIKEII